MDWQCTPIDVVDINDDDVDSSDARFNSIIIYLQLRQRTVKFQSIRWRQVKKDVHVS